jgi:hypothetical protein
MATVSAAVTAGIAEAGGSAIHRGIGKITATMCGAATVFPQLFASWVVDKPVGNIELAVERKQ